jgi:hypothetical protein
MTADRSRSEDRFQVRTCLVKVGTYPILVASQKEKFAAQSA